MHDWIKLTTRMGNDVLSPSLEAMKGTINELFQSKVDNEHPDCWLECGNEVGSLFVLSIYQSGFAVFTEYSDADMTTELQSIKIPVSTEDAALKLWLELINNPKPDFESTKS